MAGGTKKLDTTLASSRKTKKKLDATSSSTSDSISVLGPTRESSTGRRTRPWKRPKTTVSTKTWVGVGDGHR